MEPDTGVFTKLKNRLRELLRGKKRSAAIEVAAGVIEREGRVLVCKRPAGKARAGLWEFPGGKLDDGESPEEALVRELKEELGITVRPRGRLVTVTHDYGDIKVRLTAILAESAGGELRPLEGQEPAFVRVEELDSLELCAADRRIAGALAEKRGIRPAKD